MTRRARLGLPTLPRYGPLARFYDTLSFERPVYRVGRLAGIEMLQLRPGSRVLDVGCGTGLNFAPLIDRIGPRGRIVGVDASAVMLRQAKRRVATSGWRNVELRRGDAGDLAAVLRADEAFDAVLFTYSLSIIRDWQDAWRSAVGGTRPGGRVVVVDMQMPRGVWRGFYPLARLACFTGGSDPYRRPWRAVLSDTDDTAETALRGGHIQVAGGTVTACRPA